VIPPRPPSAPPRQRLTFRASTLAWLAVLGWACTAQNPAYHTGLANDPRDSGATGGAPGTGGSSPGSGGSSSGTGGRPSDAGGDPRPDQVTFDTGEETSPAPPDLATGLAGYWRFDGASGYGVIPDESGLEQTAAIFGVDVETAWVTGRLGNALRFGVEPTDSASVPPSAQLRGLAQFTIAVWINRTGNDTRSMSVLAQQQSGDVPVFKLHCVNGQLGFDHTTSANRLSMASGRPCPLGQWTHVAVTHDGSRFAFYVAGELVQTTDRTGPLVASTNPFVIGNAIARAGATSSFVGLLDELLVYTRALPPAAIKALADGVQPASKRL
jgi:hypothetical protein